MSPYSPNKDMWHGSMTISTLQSAKRSNIIMIIRTMTFRMEYILKWLKFSAHFQDHYNIIRTWIFSETILKKQNSILLEILRHVYQTQFTQKNGCLKCWKVKMSIFKTYQIGCYWNRVEFMNSYQFTETKNIDIWPSYVKNNTFFKHLMRFI